MKYYLKKNKLAIAVTIILLIASCVLCAFINNSGFSSSDLIIKQYDINLRINKDGSGSFNNYITYDFSNTDYTIIYEDIGYEKSDIFAYGDINNNKVVYENKINSSNDKSSFDYDSFVTEVYQDGKKIELTKIGYSFKGDDIEDYTDKEVDSVARGQERIFCYLRRGYNVDTTFNYQYKINGIVSKYLDIGIINWILSPSTEIDTRNINVNISFEEALTDKYVEHLKNNFYIHGNIAYQNLVINKDGVNFKVSNQKSNQSIEVRMGFDNNLVNDTKYINCYNFNAQEDLNNVEKLLNESFEDYNIRYFNIQTGLIITTFILIVLVILSWIYAYKKYDKERISKFDAEYYRELPNTYPPAEMGYLYNFKETSKDDLSATIMDLIRKGHITLDTNGQSTLNEKPNYIYRYNKDKDQSSLKSYEKFVLEWYFNHITKNDELSLNQIDEYLKKENQANRYLKDNSHFIKLVRQESRKNKFFDEFRNLNARFSLMYIILVVVIILTLIFQILNYYTYALIFSAINLGLIILLACYISSIKRRSESGNEDYVRWRAFRNFLLEFGRFEDYTMPLIKIWEHYMVYAVSFGVAEEVEKQMRLHFKSLGEDQFDSYYSSSPIFYTHSYIYIRRSCHNSTTIARSTIVQAQAARASKNISSRGGGFGGGRSFGGGGGGRGGL